MQLHTLEVTINERGNGFPDPGDYCAGDDGELYLVEWTGRIHTGSSAGCSNYIYARVSLADWDDCTEEDQHTAQVILPAR